MKFRITLGRSASKGLDSLPPKILARAVERIESLSENPKPHGCRKIAVGEDLWRIRVGDYRIVYHLDEDNLAIDIITVRHRKHSYK